jgi:hypothetical protein
MEKFVDHPAAHRRAASQTIGSCDFRARGQLKCHRKARPEGAISRAGCADGKPWSEMDLFDLRNSLAYGTSIEEVAGFLWRSGTVEEVKRKAEELALLRFE